MHCKYCSGYWVFSILTWLLFGFLGFSQYANAAARLTLSAVSYDGKFTISYQAFNDPTDRVYLTLSKNAGAPSYWYGAYERTGNHRYSNLSTGTYTVKVGYDFSIHVDRNNSWVSNGRDVIVVRAPGRPSSIAVPVTIVQDGRMVLAWGKSGGLVGRYELQQSKDGSGWTTQYNGNQRADTLTGLNDGEYRYRVRACKDLAGYSNCGAWRTASTAVKVLNVPGIPGLINGPAVDGDGEFTLSWNASAGAVDYYQLEQKHDAGDWQAIQSGLMRSKNIILAKKGLYYFRVMACNSSGCNTYRSNKQV